MCRPLYASEMVGTLRSSAPWSSIDSLDSRPINRREVLSCCAKAIGLPWMVGPWMAGLSTGLVAPGCSGPTAVGSLRKPDLIWGRQGLSDGRFTKPRAMAIDSKDTIFIVDMTGRIQAFDRDGKFLRGWRTPEFANGRPTGLGIANDGSIMVADTHYFRVLFYTPEGELQDGRTIGGVYGNEPSNFHFVTDVVQDRHGHILAGQYGIIDQIQEFSENGEFLRRWGRQGSELDAFARPQGFLIDDQNQFWIADAHNHRILVFGLETEAPSLKYSFGSFGSEPGQLHYPYGISLDKDNSLLVAEKGNHRVQRFTKQGKSMELWGEPGSGPGQFSSPWAVIVDSRGAIHVLDTLNHRVQRFSV